MKIKIVRLPDIDNYRYLEPQYDDYGRFGKTRNGNFYVSGLKSSHDKSTEIGGYWASNKHNQILYLSPRGVALDFEKFVKEIVENGNIDSIKRKAGIR